MLTCPTRRVEPAVVPIIPQHHTDTTLHTGDKARDRTPRLDAQCQGTFWSTGLVRRLRQVARARRRQRMDLQLRRHQDRVLLFHGALPREKPTTTGMQLGWRAIQGWRCKPCA